jgi:hypothetical protein
MNEALTGFYSTFNSDFEEWTKLFQDSEWIILGKLYNYISYNEMLAWHYIENWKKDIFEMKEDFFNIMSKKENDDLYLSKKI